MIGKLHLITQFVMTKQMRVDQIIHLFKTRMHFSAGECRF